MGGGWRERWLVGVDEGGGRGEGHEDRRERVVRERKVAG